MPGLIAEKKLVGEQEKGRGMDAVLNVTEDMEKEIKNALDPGPQEEILTGAFPLQITRKDIQTLKNGEVINFYLNLLIERNNKKGYTALHVFNIFFYPKLKYGGYCSVKQWTRGIKLFEKEIILVPIHQKAKMGRRQCKSAYNIIKNKTTPESSPPPTPKSDYCNADKAEENDLKKSLMKMLEEDFEEKMKNLSKEIGENTNKKLEEINKEIEEKKSKKLEEMNNEIEEKKNKKLKEMNNEIEEKKNKRVEEMNKEIEEKETKTTGT
ncbi:hypothetical protein STEG23_014582 [Scotinomys teguina]